MSHLFVAHLPNVARRYTNEDGVEYVVVNLKAAQQGVVSDVYGRDYIVHQNGAVQRLTKKQKAKKR